MNRPVTLTGTFELLSDRELLEEEMENLENLLETPRRAAVYGHFANRFLTQPDEQPGGVRETIGNYLQYFLTPEVAEVFCTGESTFDFASLARRQTPDRSRVEKSDSTDARAPRKNGGKSSTTCAKGDR